MVFSFGPFEPPSKRKNDTNDISFESPDVGKVILPLWKALSSRNWNLERKLEYLDSERLQTNFSEGGAFLVNWAVAPPG